MKTTAIRSLTLVLCLAVVVAVATGCQRGRQQPIETGLDDSDAWDQRAQDTDGDQLPDVDMADILFERDTGLRTVYFDFDDSSLRSDARETLRRNAEMIQEHPGVMIQIEGHTCRIGTQEYNLALGDRRANSVRRYLIDLGVDPNRLVTLSYGQEMPANPGNSEEALSQNRRAEFSRAM